MSLQVLTENPRNNRQNAFSLIGTKVDATSWQDAVAQAPELNFEVEKRQLEVAGTPVDAWGIFRKDQDPQSGFFGTVGSIHQSLQNADMLGFCNEVIGGFPGAKYETVGAINNGATVFATANLGGFSLNGDDHRATLTFKNPHIGQSPSAAVSVERKVCSNGLHVWVRGVAFRFRHSTNIAQRVKDAVRDVEKLGLGFQRVEQQLRELGNRQMTKETTRELLNKLFPTKPDVDSKFTNSKKVAVMDLFQDNDGNRFPEQKGSALNFLNAVTEFVDHYAPVMVGGSQQVEVVRALQGTFNGGAELKQNALELILEATEEAPRRSVYSYESNFATADGILLNDILTDLTARSNN